MKPSPGKSTATGRQATGQYGAAAAPAPERDAPAVLEAISEIARVVGLPVDADDKYAGAFAAARRVLPFDGAAVARIDPAGRTITRVHVEGGSAGATQRERSVPLEDTVAGRAIHTGGAVHVSADGAGDVLSAVAVPLVFDGTPVGALTFQSSKTGAYSEADFPFLECMAGLLAGVVYGQGVERTLAEQNKERAALSRIHEVVNSSLVLDDVYELFADEVRKLLPSERVTVWSVDPAQDTCTVAWVSGLHVSGVEPGEVEQLGRSPAGEVAESRRGLVLRSAGKNDAAARFPATGMEFAAGIRSILVVPLISRDELVGTLQLGSTKPDAYAPRDVALAEEVGAQIAGAMANSQIYLQAVQLSEERELRARLDAENRELLHLNQEKSRFTSLVSHELRSPLTSILAFSDLLARNREGNLTAGQIEWVNTLRRNGRMMNVLIDDLLSLSRIEAGTFRLARRVFEARRALEEQVEGFAPIVDAKKQSIAVSLPDEPLWVDADPDRFAQVVSNLVSNASKYSPEGSTIELSAWPEADRLHVRVQDHGIGVSREDQRKLFTPFFRAENKATRTETGTGLGLCITKSLVEMHGGRIAVESGSGAGTTIDFHIRGLLTAPAEALDAGGEEHLAPHLAGTLA